MKGSYTQERAMILSSHKLVPVALLKNFPVQIAFPAGMEIGDL
jgi:hypothetical protein